MAYRQGKMDDDVLRMTDMYSMFTTQARYVTSRKSLSLWARVLRHDNPRLSNFVASALDLDVSDPVEMGTMRLAFIRAGLEGTLLGAGLHSSFAIL